MLHHVFDVIYQTQMQHRKATNLDLGSREVYQPFLCSNHQKYEKEIIQSYFFLLVFLLFF